MFVGEDPVLNRMFAVKTISLTGIGYKKEVEVRWFAGTIGDAHSSVAVIMMLTHPPL